MRPQVDRQVVLESLRDLADKEFQSRAWLGLIPNEVHLFEESVEYLYGDSGLDDALAAGQAYSTEIDAAFREFKRILWNIDYLQTPQALIADPTMELVRAAAATLIAKLEAFQP